MYVPEHFREDDVGVMHALMRQRPFAILITHGEDGLTAPHLPTVLKPEPAPYGSIEAHLARPNSQWRSVGEGAEALLIYSGPEHYIHPGWYPSKAEHGKAVPTWNYAAVHAYGCLTVMTDADWLRRHVGELSDQQERERPTPWSLADAPEAYVGVMLRGIVGLRFEISRLEGKWKMSQNRDAADRAGVVAGLSADGDPGSVAVAAMVAERKELRQAGRSARPAGLSLRTLRPVNFQAISSISKRAMKTRLASRSSITSSSTRCSDRNSARRTRCRKFPRRASSDCFVDDRAKASVDAAARCNRPAAACDMAGCGVLLRIRSSLMRPAGVM